ncbi:hypothetical protein PsorP6_006864 [Peronosclerospora sorghi]|uniref:Uncharacterized protein n=1 Tax=Peronosclerospora sorghi TaxID=230839 RepID=A0ACC0W882_9STRA|nr:hypothetical protein PsorP6_006864 [Peronosclerospora sorghi]
MPTALDAGVADAGISRLVCMCAAHSMTALAEVARETELAQREQLELEPSFLTARSPFSDMLRSTRRLSPALAVRGRVFRRLQRFHLLSPDRRAQSDMIATYLLAPTVRLHVFEWRRHWWQHPFHLMKAGHGMFVQGRKLVQSILDYLVLSVAANTTLRNAQELAETLVLSGFLSPVDESSEENDEPLSKTYVLDDDYYELVAPGATGIVLTPHVATTAMVDCNPTTSLRGAIVVPLKPSQSPLTRNRPSQAEGLLSVWAVTDGATCAGFVNRQWKGSHVRSLFGIEGKLKHCYAVVNKPKYHSLVLFETDVARHALVCYDLTVATVKYFGLFALKICTDGNARAAYHGNRNAVETFVFTNKPEQEQWLLALLDAGASFLETHPLMLSFAAPSVSLYSLQDTDAEGNTFYLSELRGHVALLTTVASGSSNTDAKQFTQLAELAREYQNAGLQVVAFPTAQFGDAEFDNDEELVTSCRAMFDADFPILATRDSVTPVYGFLPVTGSFFMFIRRDLTRSKGKDVKAQAKPETALAPILVMKPWPYCAAIISFA